MTKTKLCAVLRGCPSAGKSTKARQIVSEATKNGQASLICSTDDFFVEHGNGVYKFEATLLGKAHNQNYKKFCKAIDDEVEIVIVDNTNIRVKDFKPYVIYANNAGYEIVLIEPTTEWAWDADECFKRSTHNVPRATIERMINQYQHNVNVEDIINS